jgi:hypothetical protein
MAVEFEDNRMVVIEAISNGVSAFLYEAGGELQAQTQRNSRVDTGQTKGSYQYKVEEESDKGTVYVGSNLENAIWEEFGTGEYALGGDGRRGGWVYKSQRNGKFYRTKGKTPNRPMYNAFNFLREKLKKRLEEILKSRL